MGDFSGFALHIHGGRGARWGLDSYLVISSGGLWCRSPDFDGPRFAVLFRHVVLEGKFPNFFFFYLII